MTRCGPVTRVGSRQTAVKTPGYERRGADTTNQSAKTRLLATDDSPEELLRPRRFSWEQD